MIKPKIGLPFLYKNSTGYFCPAIICLVHSDTCVNVGGFTEHGQHFAHTSVILYQGLDACKTGQVIFNLTEFDEMDSGDDDDIDEIVSDDIADDEIETDSGDSDE